MRENDCEINGVLIPVAEAAEMMAKSAALGMSFGYYVGSLALAGAYGVAHPRVIELHKAAKAGITGPEMGEEK